VLLLIFLYTLLRSDRAFGDRKEMLSNCVFVAVVALRLRLPQLCGGVKDEDLLLQRENQYPAKDLYAGV
jgi:hypothetical protein